MNPTEGLVSLSELIDATIANTGEAEPSPVTSTPETTVPDPVETPAPEVVATQEVPAVEPEAKEKKKGAAGLLDDESPVETPVTPDPDAEKPPKGLSDDAKVKWGELRAEAREAKTLKETVAKLELQLKDAGKLQDSDPLKAKIAEYEAAIQERDKRLAQYDVRNDPAFQKEVGIPLQASKDSLKALAAELDLPMAKVEDAIYQPDSKSFRAAMKEAMESLDTTDAFEVLNRATKIRELEIKALEIEANAKPALDEAKAREKEATEKATLERKATQMRTVEEMGKKLASTFKLLTVDGGPDAEKLSASIMAEAQSTAFDDMEMADQAAAIIALPALAHAKEAIKSRDILIASLRRQLSGKAAASPSPAKVSPAITADQEEIPSGPDEMFRRTFGGR